MRSPSRLTQTLHIYSTRTLTASRKARPYRTMASPTTMPDTSLDPVYFWREYEEPYGFLSQWYDSPFEVDGVTYASTEMWMMIQKARLFGDEVCAFRRSARGRSLIAAGF